MPLRLWRRDDRRSSNWYVMGTVAVWRDGRKTIVKIKQQSTRTPDRHEAEAILHQIEASYRKSNIENRDPPKTFAHLVHAYLDAGKSERFLIPVVRALGDMTPDQLTQALVDREGRRAYPKAAPATLRRQWHGVITAVLKHSRAPVQFDKPAASKPSTKWCSAPEADAIIKAVASAHRSNSRSVALVEFLFGSGCRSGEAVTILGRDIDLRYGTATFRDTKSGFERLTPLPERTVRAIKAMVEEFGLLPADRPAFLKADGTPYAHHANRGTRMRFLETAAASVGVQLNPHMTRHSYATWFLSQTNNKPHLRHFGGWRSDAIVDRYAHFVPVGVGKDARALGWDFGALIEKGLEHGYDNENYG